MHTYKLPGHKQYVEFLHVLYIDKILERLQVPLRSGKSDPAEVGGPKRSKMAEWGGGALMINRGVLPAKNLRWVGPDPPPHTPFILATASTCWGFGLLYYYVF